ncbi:hypothetical protein GW915_10960 [bacterium]|nr:hypothetical protein [bacterium]
MKAIGFILFTTFFLNASEYSGAQTLPVDLRTGGLVGNGVVELARIPPTREDKKRTEQLNKRNEADRLRAEAYKRIGEVLRSYGSPEALAKAAKGGEEFLKQQKQHQTDLRRLREEGIKIGMNAASFPPIETRENILSYIRGGALSELEDRTVRKLEEIAKLTCNRECVRFHADAILEGDDIQTIDLIKDVLEHPEIDENERLPIVKELNKQSNNRRVVINKAARKVYSNGIAGQH